MAKYRCPQCGSPHKQAVDKCTICGASMDTLRQASTIKVASDSRLDPTNFDKVGLGHFVLAGVALLAVVSIGAISLGLVESDSVFFWLQDNDVPGFDTTLPDGWLRWTDEEVMVVDLPQPPAGPNGPSAPEEGEFDLSFLNGTVTRYDSQLGESTEIILFYTEGNNFTATSETYREDIDAFNDAFASGIEGSVLSVDNGTRTVTQEATEELDEEVRYRWDGIIDSIGMPYGQAFASVRFHFVDGEVFGIITVNPNLNPEHFIRVRNSFVLLADDPTAISTAVTSEQAERGLLTPEEVLAAESGSTVE